MKPQLIGELAEKLQEVRFAFSDQVEDYVEFGVKKIFEETLQTFNEFSNAQERIILQQLNALKHENENIGQFIGQIQEQKRKVQEARERIAGING